MYNGRRFRAYFDMVFFCLPRYLSRATSSRWPTEDREYMRDTRITRTRSCPGPRIRERPGVSTIPVRAIGLRQSESYDLSLISAAPGGLTRSASSMAYTGALRRGTEHQQSVRTEVISLEIPEPEQMF